MRVEIINKREFAKEVLDENAETFVVYIIILLTLLIYSSPNTQLGLLLADKPSIEVPPKYSDYTDIFLFDLAIRLP